MGKGSAIAWTDHTFNPWWGCVRVSPGCEHCYAETFAHRVGLDVWGPTAQRRVFGDKHWDEPLAWEREAIRSGERRRVFCASMADVFESLPGTFTLEVQRARLWNLIARTPHLDWLLLTKRPENVTNMVPASWVSEDPARRVWPHNVWLGVTAEDQQRANQRVWMLMTIPGPKVRFVSYEPALGAVDLTALTLEGLSQPVNAFVGLGRVSWVIVGGESGHAARAFDIGWARRMRDACDTFDVAFFMKQLGSRIRWRLVDGTLIGGDSGTSVQSRTVGGVVAMKGDNPDEWPEDLRIQEFPA